MSSKLALALGLVVSLTGHPVWAAPAVESAVEAESPASSEVTPPAAETEPSHEAAPAAEAPSPPMIPPPPEPLEVDPRHFRMVLAGDIIIGLSGAGMVAMAVGLGIRSDALTQRQALSVSDPPDAQAIAKQQQRITNGALIATIGGVSAVALLTTGITLVALGYRRERLRRMSLPGAALGPDHFGLTWALRF